LAPVIDRAVAAGVDILTVNGNTGEFYGLSTSEAVTMVQSVCKLVDGRVPVVAGIGLALPDALALTHASVAAGADALMIHQPPDPFVAPRGVCDCICATMGLGWTPYHRCVQSRVWSVSNGPPPIRWF